MKNREVYTNGLDNVVIDEVKDETVYFWHYKQRYYLSLEGFNSEFSKYNL